MNRAQPQHGQQTTPLLQQQAHVQHQQQVYQQVQSLAQTQQPAQAHVQHHQQYQQGQPLSQTQPQQYLQQQQAQQVQYAPQQQPNYQQPLSHTQQHQYSQQQTAGAGQPMYVTTTMDGSAMGGGSTVSGVYPTGYLSQMAAAYHQQPFIYQQQMAPAAVPHFAQQKRDDAILKQIEVYFNPYNLKKDTSLRRNMDEKGFIPLILVAGFPRVQSITNDLMLISRVLQRSNELELSPDHLKVRPRRDWHLWPLASLTEKFVEVDLSGNNNNDAESLKQPVVVKATETTTVEATVAEKPASKAD